MSATATFLLPATVNATDIRTAVEKIWTGDSVDVRVEPDGRISLQLRWYVQPHEQASELRRIAVLLMKRAGSEPVFYIRDSDATCDDAPDYPRPITVDDLVSADFAPAMHDGIHYRYRLRGGAV